jgi:G3E family GTPase
MSKIRRVATEASADHLLVHAAAHSDLKTLAKTFTVADANGALLSDNAQLQSLVAVVDAPELLKTLPTEAARPMVERIELADVIIVQGGQELPAEEGRRLDDLIRALNPTARTIREDGTKLELSSLRSDQPFDLRAAELRASRLGKPDTDFGTSGWLRQFTYFERIPFHPVRLHAMLEENWPNVIRVQGSFWVASSPDYSITLDIAGGSRQTSREGKWWITVPQDQRPKSPGFLQYLEGIWDPTFGDRHQALTIVGMGLDQDALTQRLKQCLLTDEEMAHPETWPLMPHPFSWPQQ